MAIHAVKVEDFHSKLTSCSACHLAGRMAIHAVKVEDFHSKLTSCSACRRAGRMAIHAVKVEDFHSNFHHAQPAAWLVARGNKKGVKTAFTATASHPVYLYLSGILSCLSIPSRSLPRSAHAVRPVPAPAVRPHRDIRSWAQSSLPAFSVRLPPPHRMRYRR